MLTSLLLAAVLQALPPCELPDLDVSSAAWSSDFRVQALAGGSLGIAMSNPVGEDGAHLPGNPTDSAPPGAHSGSTRWLWSEASGWLLVPKALEISIAVVGVDGSWIIEMRDPEASDQHLRAQGTGACVGCAYSAGAPLFDTYAKEARDNEFEFCRGLTWPITRDEGSVTRLRFHYDNARGLRHDAVAVIGDDEISYTALTVSGLEPVVTDEIVRAFAP